MTKLIVQIISNALAIFLAVYLVPGIVFEGDILTLIIAGLILALINLFIKPVLHLLSAPLILLSLGLFSLVINIGLLWLLEYFVNELMITGLTNYLWGTLIISLVNISFSLASKKNKD